MIKRLWTSLSDGSAFFFISHSFAQNLVLLSVKLKRVWYDEQDIEDLVVYLSWAGGQLAPGQPLSINLCVPSASLVFLACSSVSVWCPLFCKWPWALQWYYQLLWFFDCSYFPVFCCGPPLLTPGAVCHSFQYSDGIAWVCHLTGLIFCRTQTIKTLKANVRNA